MNIEKKIEKLQDIYDLYERDVAEFKQQAVCRLGCTFCCTCMGTVDAATLEGLVIQERINRMQEQFRSDMQSELKRDRLTREKGEKSRCPFLDDKGACLIYDVRPFSCRQLYSIRECDSRGPMLHRQAVETSRKTVGQIQKLDKIGYSGHLGFILKLLDSPEFRKVYLSGGFDPKRIMQFGRKHGVAINRYVK